MKEKGMPTLQSISRSNIPHQRTCRLNQSLIVIDYHVSGGLKYDNPMTAYGFYKRATSQAISNKCWLNKGIRRQPLCVAEMIESIWFWSLNSSQLYF